MQAQSPGSASPRCEIRPEALSSYEPALKLEWLGHRAPEAQCKASSPCDMTRHTPLRLSRALRRHGPKGVLQADASGGIAVQQILHGAGVLLRRHLGEPAPIGDGVVAELLAAVGVVCDGARSRGGEQPGTCRGAQSTAAARDLGRGQTTTGQNRGRRQAAGAGGGRAGGGYGPSNGSSPNATSNRCTPKAHAACFSTGSVPERCRLRFVMAFAAAITSGARCALLPSGRCRGCISRSQLASGSRTAVPKSESTTRPATRAVAVAACVVRSCLRAGPTCGTDGPRVPAQRALSLRA